MADAASGSISSPTPTANRKAKTLDAERQGEHRYCRGPRRKGPLYDRSLGMHDLSRAPDAMRRSK